MSAIAMTVARPTAGLASALVATDRRPVASARGCRGGRASTSGSKSSSSSSAIQSRNLTQRHFNGGDAAAMLAVRSRAPITIARRRSVQVRTLIGSNNSRAPSHRWAPPSPNNLPNVIPAFRFTYADPSRSPAHNASPPHPGAPWTRTLNPKPLNKHPNRSPSQTNASLFGVGAPEALVIGVVALLVFGPKGLADIAKQLGQTLRAFQPTIKELQEVSREFRDTLEDEIGLDEIRNDIAGVTAPVPTKRQAPAPNPVSADTAVSAPSAPSADESENMVTKEMRAQAAAAAWGGDEPEQPAAPVEPPAAVTEIPSELSAPEPAEPAAPEPAGEEKA